MNVVRIGDTIYSSFTLSNSGGSAMSADSAPSGVIYQNASATPIAYKPVVTSADELGTYLVEIAATVGNGFSLGNSYNCVVSAVVDSVTGRAAILSFYAVSAYAENISGYSTLVSANISGMVDQSLSAYGTSGVAEKIYQKQPIIKR